MNFKFYLLIALVFLSLSCKERIDHSQSDKIVKSAKERSIMEFGKDYTRAWNSQKPKNVALFFARDGSLIVNNGDPLKGRQEITEFTRGFMEAFPDLELSMDSLVIKPKETFYHWSFNGTNSGPEGTGNKVHFSGLERWTFDDSNLIKLSIGSFDEENYNRQVNGL